MCYSAEAATRRLLEYAIYRGDLKTAALLEQQLQEILRGVKPSYFVSGFAHPNLLVFTNEAPRSPQLFSWGLIPAWTKDLATAMKNRRNLLNARSESMFELNSFKHSAMYKRCLIYLDAFYEYHSANGKKYPFRIQQRDNAPLAMAGLWAEWVDKSSGEIYNTCCIVTTAANTTMAKIHNLPAASDTPRMPVILPKEKQDEWLLEIRNDADKEHILSLCVPYDDQLIEAYSVGPLIGKAGLGNVPEAREKCDYPDLKF